MKRLALRAFACLFACVSAPALSIPSDSNEPARGVFGALHSQAPTASTGSITPPAPGDRTQTVRRWNAIAIDASGLDHTPVAAGDDRVFGEQLGPGRSARAMAIVHVAMFDAANAIERGYVGYAHRLPAPRLTSFEAAVATAAHDTLAVLYPSQREFFDFELARDLQRIPPLPRALGFALGRLAAVTILLRRHHDGSNHAEPLMDIDYVPGEGPGIWRADPLSAIPIALGAHWAEVDTFVIGAPEAWRVPPPPDMGSDAYAAAFEEVKAFGGDGVVTPTIRNADETHIGLFWAYDGTPSLCAPPRLYNQVANQIADQMGTEGMERLRLLTLINVAMADTGIAAWESKYHYAFWRPVIGVREADPGTGPTGLGDGNAATLGDPDFTPLGAPASNLSAPNFTPPFPAYPSGHAAFGGALFQILRRYYGTDDLAFTFVSDEFNGVTVDNQGNVRPHLPRSFDALSQAEEENGQSRIYLGIHWSFDKTEGIAQGRAIADHVFDHVLRPR